MKKILLIILCAAAILIPFVEKIQKTHAATKPTLSLSDAILADLALHNYLDYVSIDFKDIKSPNTVSINETHQWLPASTIKLFVAMYAANQIIRKNISASQWVTIDEKNVVPTELETNDYPVLTPGLITTVDILLKKMITQSDNTAYNTLLDLLDRQKVTQFVQSLGLKHTIIGSKLNLDDAQTQYEYTTPGYNINTTTAADYEKAYELIDQGKIPGSKSLFTILSEQKIQNMIPALLPIKQLTIAHKTGDLDPLYHDGGIIIGNNKHYILTIFTNLGNPNIIAHLSQLIFTQNYKLVGADIPDKNVIQGPQALDPLVLNPEGFKKVLGAQTEAINVPIPQITAADLGITPSDLSLTLPDSKLPPVIISPSSPLHGIITTWYGLQTVIAVGDKKRQQAALSYAKQLIADAKQLQKSGNTEDASNNLQQVEQVLHTVALNPATQKDTQTQIDTKAVSDTQFALLKTVVDDSGNDSARIAALQQVADTVKDHLSVVQPNIPAANAATTSTNPPLIAHVVDVKDGEATVLTSSGATITVPLSSSTKIIESTDTQPAQPANPSPTEIAGSPSESPSTSPTSSNEPQIEKGQTIALLGTIKGNVLTPSVVVTNLHQELAAPQPVTVVKVNTDNNTMVVSENGNPIQIDLAPETPIKAKDTNVPLDSIQPGTVIVVHGTEVQQVNSDTLPTPSVTQEITPTTQPGSSKQPTNNPTTTTPTATSPTSKTTIMPTQQSTNNATPTIAVGKTISPSPVPTSQNTITGKIPTPTNSSTNKPGATIQPTTSTKTVTTVPVVTTKPQSTIPVPTNSPVSQQAPKVIQATSVQVVQQKPTTPTAPAPTTHSQPSTPQPVQQQPAQPAQPAQAAPQPTVDTSKKK